MTFKITDSQQIQIDPPTVTDKRGNPTTLDAMTLSSSDPAILTVTDNGDGSGTAVAAGPLGSATLILDADADLGDGVRPIQGTAEVEVVAGDAAIVNMNLGAVSEQPDSPTP